MLEHIKEIYNYFVEAYCTRYMLNEFMALLFGCLARPSSRNVTNRNDEFLRYIYLVFVYFLKFYL